MTELTPWDVPEKEINYSKLIEHFGCKKVDSIMIEKLEKITNKKVHHLIKRGFVFAHRDLDIILDNKKDFYLYTGRGPSTKSLHIGHSIPFILCKYLQDVFNVPLVIQITDDEKFLFKDLKLTDSMSFAIENIKDIIAFGFDPEKTYIFKNSEIYQKNNSFFQMELQLSKEISLNEGSKIFGFDQNSNLGQISFPIRQILPCFYKTFPFLRKSSCLVPAAIDQDPYFRLARDKSKIFKCNKPSSIYTSFLPSLMNLGKMSSSKEKTIFLSDTQEEIRNKIKKNAFSGGKETLKEHKEFGGNPDRDTAFQYLRYFLEDDEELENIRKRFISGDMTSLEIKNRCIEVIQEFVRKFQEKRAKITDEIIQKFLSSEKDFYKK